MNVNNLSSRCWFANNYKKINEKQKSMLHDTLVKFSHVSKLPKAFDKTYHKELSFIENFSLFILSNQLKVVKKEVEKSTTMHLSS